MDRNLISIFDQWYNSQKEFWEQKGVSVDKLYDVPFYEVQRYIYLSSQYAEAQVGFYQSNGYWWVDFEAFSFDNDEIYIKSVLDFLDVEGLKIQTEIVNKYLTGAEIIN